MLNSAVFIGNDSAVYGYPGPGTTLANDMIFVMNHAPGSGSIMHKKKYLTLFHILTDYLELEYMSTNVTKFI